MFYLISILLALNHTLLVLSENVSDRREKLLDEIRIGAKWKAGLNSRFEKASIADVRRQLGTILPNQEGYVQPTQAINKFQLVSPIPEKFDAREAWPECANIIGHVRDQSDCGSCWAFSATEAFNDRYCIATGDYKTLFSPEDTVSCCTGLSCQLSMGCNGGQPAGAWHWFTTHGVATGGDYDNVNDGTSCKPYSLEACAHHFNPPAGMVPCDSLKPFHTPKCVSKCTDLKYTGSYAKDRHFASTSYGIVGEKDMQIALMEKGTLSVAMSVFEDFELYKSGIYHHVSGSFLGGHAIKLVGWGVEDGTPYWICINSWNTGWGEGGSFRILRGSNEVGIESFAVAGDIAV